MNDKAIEFESIRFNTERTIKHMKEIGLNVSKYEKKFSEIITECENGNKSMPDSIDTYDSSTFATDYMASSYSTAIKKLEILLLELSKYEIYIQVSTFTNYVKLFIDNPTKTEEDFKMYRDSIIDILNKLLKSQTLDYDVEGNIVEEIYQITYYFIKEEIKFFGVSQTLDALKDNDIHLSFLNKEVIRELETLDLKNPKYKGLLAAKMQIDIKGLNPNYAEEDFLRRIAAYELDYRKISQVIESLIQKVNDNLSMLTRINFEREKNSSKSNNTYITKLRKDIFKNIALFVTSGSILFGMIFGSIKLNKRLERKYKNTTRTYSLSDGIITETSYNLNDKNSTTINELTPYEKDKNNQFLRTKITYDVSKVGDIPLEEYLNLDLEALGIKAEEVTEKVDSLGLNDLYEDMIRYVEETIVDEDDYEEGFSVFGFIIELGLVALLQLFCELIYCETYFNEDEYFSLLYAIISIIEDIQELKRNKPNRKELATEVKKLNAKVEALFKDNELLIKRLEDYYQMVKDNPDYAEENEKIEDTIKLVRRKMNNENN